MEMIRERTRSGLCHARELGRRSGRKPKLSMAQILELLEAVTSGRKSGAEVARLFEIHPSTVSRLVGREKFAEHYLARPLPGAWAWASPGWGCAAAKPPA
jgi:DNA invertase Pin-like site-specific DNA recombinase